MNPHSYVFLYDWEPDGPYDSGNIPPSKQTPGAYLAYRFKDLDDVTTTNWFKFESGRWCILNISNVPKEYLAWDLLLPHVN